MTVCEKPTRVEEWIELRLGKPVDRAINDLYNEGLSQEQVAKKLGISRPTLRDIQRRRGLRVARHLVPMEESIG